MKIGIVIGVSEYESVQPLNGCKTDAKIIRQLLELSNKCDELLYIDSDTTSKSVKSKLSTFVKNYENETIEEVIFYFSGHGLFEDNEFYYILTDYREAKLRQTSLENSELDNMLRSLNSALTIKIVDACQAGKRYIKDPTVFRKYLQSSEKGFDKCYFFYSSQEDQYSYQSKSLSDFTLAFVESFAQHSNQEVRYKDIVDSIADKFTGNLKQTPYFIVQGNYTELFGFISDEVSQSLFKSIRDNIWNNNGGGTPTKNNLLESIKTNAELYCNKEEAIEALNQLLDCVKKYKFSNEIGDLFNISIDDTIDSKLPIKSDYVGRTLSEGNKNYMVEIQRELRTRMVPKNKGLLGINYSNHFFGLDEKDMVEEKYSAPIGAISVVELPYDFIIIRLNSKYPNINDTGCILLPFVSQINIGIFYAFFNYKIREWDVKTIDNGSICWSNYETQIKNLRKIGETISQIFDEYSNFIMDPIKKTFENTSNQDHFPNDKDS